MIQRRHVASRKQANTTLAQAHRPSKYNSSINGLCNCLSIIRVHDRDVTVNDNFQYFVFLSLTKPWQNCYIYRTTVTSLASAHAKTAWLRAHDVMRPLWRHCVDIVHASQWSSVLLVFLWLSIKASGSSVQNKIIKAFASKQMIPWTLSLSLSTSLRLWCCKICIRHANLFWM